MSELSSVVEMTTGRQRLQETATAAVLAQWRSLLPGNGRQHWPRLPAVPPVDLSTLVVAPSITIDRRRALSTRLMIHASVRCLLTSTYVNQSINQSMAVTDAGTKVPLYPYHTFYTLLIFKST